MKNINKMAFFSLAIVLAFAGMQAMQPDDTDEANCTPAHSWVRPRGSRKTPTPQLARRILNHAQENNCGYIAVKVAIQAPFTDGIKVIMDSTKLKGHKVDSQDHFLTLFSFNVPITNELVARMPKSIGLKREAKYLRPDEKQMLVDHIKEVTEALVNRERENRVFRFDLEQVIAENGNATAYFIPSSDLGGFIDAVTAIRAHLEQKYRWGMTLQDGVWFDFQKADEIRPSLRFLTSKHNGRGNILQRAVSSLTASSTRSSDKRISAEQSLLRTSAQDAHRLPMLSAQRTSNQVSAHETSQNKSTGHSPQRSPRDSGDESSLRSYTDTYWGDSMRTLEVTGNKLRIETEIVEKEVGNC